MTDSKETRRKRYGHLWRRWAGSIAFVLLIILTTGGFYALEREGDIREKQFCNLIVGDYEDRVKQVEQTEEYLSLPIGMERTGLNDYIRRVSLPRLKEEIERDSERFPSVCEKYKTKG